MSPIARRPAPPVVSQSFVPFLSRKFYVPGFGLPEGDYCLFFDVRLHQYTKKDGSTAGPQFLATMATAYNLHDLTAEPILQPYGMGASADKSFMPDETGKKLVAVPGGPGASTMNNQTNWSLFFDSLVQSGLPDLDDPNDLAQLDGIHVHIIPQPEPEGRKNMKRSRTAENADEVEDKGPKMIPLVSEILDSGKPWEGTGGLPDATKPAPAKVAPIRPVGRPAPKAVAAPEPVEEVAGDDDLKDLVVNAISSVLGEGDNANGMPKLKLRTSTYKELQKVDQATAEAGLSKFFENAVALSAVLAELGYKVAGPQIKPIE